MNFKKYTKKVGLTALEKKNMRDAICSFVFKQEPTKKTFFNRHINWGGEKNFFLLILNSKPMIASIIAAVLIAFSGGTAAAAENTVPGDLLYPIKTKINEEVRSALALTSEAKINWENRRAERRLEETEKLAAENKLTTTTAAMLTTKFQEFATRADDRLEKLQASGKLTDEQVEKIKENFEVAVKAYEEVLTRIQDKEITKPELRGILDQLRNQASSIIRARVEKETRLLEENSTTTLKTVAENRKNAASRKIEEVEKFISANTNKVSVENKNQATKKITESKAQIAAGNTFYTAEKYGEAVVEYSNAHRTAQEAKMYMTLRFRMERGPVSTTTTSTPKLNNVEKPEEKTIRENIKTLEQKIRAEVRDAREGLRGRLTTPTTTGTAQ